MFTAFTWRDFIEYLLLIVLSYYVLIIYLYYREDFHKFLFSFFRKQKSKTDSTLETTDQLTIAHELVSELSKVIREAAETGMAIPEMLFALQTIIKDFTVLKPTEYKDKVNKYIAEEFAVHGIGGIATDEIENLWKA